MALMIISVTKSSSTPRAGAHARRKFFDAVKLNPKETTWIQIFAQMDDFLELISGLAKKA
jgi:hypothetical protein